MTRPEYFEINGRKGSETSPETVWYAANERRSGRPGIKDSLYSSKISFSDHNRDALMLVCSGSSSGT